MQEGLSNNSNYFINQSLMFDIRNKNFYIFGIGFIGSNLVLSLLKAGAGKIFCFDNDIIEEKNISNQVYKTNSVGETKINGIKEIYNNFNIRTKLYTKNVNLEKDDLLKKLEIIGKEKNNFIVIAVDNFKLREKIYKDFILRNLDKQNIDLIIDVRTDHKLGYIHMFKPTKEKIIEEINNLNELDKNYNKEEYEKTICGNKNTIFYGQILNGFILNNLMNYLNKNYDNFYKEIIYLFKEMELRKFK